MQGRVCLVAALLSLNAAAGFAQGRGRNRAPAQPPAPPVPALAFPIAQTCEPIQSGRVCVQLATA